jgi:hypothetical protein
MKSAVSDPNHLETNAMKQTLKLACLTFLSAFSAAAFAASPASGPRTMSPLEIKAAVDSYLIKTLSQGRHAPLARDLPQSVQSEGGRPFANRDDDCNRPGDTQACVDVSCALLGHWGCDEQTEVTQVLRACRGNRDGACVSKVCEKLGHWGCDEMTEIEQVATACQYNDGGACIDVACNKLGHWGCDEVTEVVQVTAACAGQYDDGACLESVCTRLGNWGCDEMTEVVQVLNECGGH